MPSANIGEHTVTDNQTKCLIPAVVDQAWLCSLLPRVAQSIILTAVRRDETCRKATPQGFNFVTSRGHKSPAVVSAGELKLNFAQRNIASVHLQEMWAKTCCIMVTWLSMAAVMLLYCLVRCSSVKGLTLMLVMDKEQSGQLVWWLISTLSVDEVTLSLTWV